MRVLAIDPGNEQSAFVVYDHGRPLSFGKESNEEMLWRLEHGDFGPTVGTMECAHLAIEMIASYGMPVGAEVFDTCVWIGRFVQQWCNTHSFVFRRDVKLHLCGQARAKDSNVRQALLDRFGGKDKAIGKKATPGPLYGMRADMWQALAVAVTWSDTLERCAEDVEASQGHQCKATAFYDGANCCALADGHEGDHQNIHGSTRGPWGSRDEVQVFLAAQYRRTHQ